MPINWDVLVFFYFLITIFPDFDLISRNYIFKTYNENSDSIIMGFIKYIAKMLISYNIL